MEARRRPCAGLRGNLRTTQRGRSTPRATPGKRLQARQFRRWSIDAKPPTKPMTYIRLRGRARDAQKNKPYVTHCHVRLYKSGRQDLNLRPSEPHSDALARLRHAPYRPASPANLISITALTRFCNRATSWNSRPPAVILLAIENDRRPTGAPSGSDFRPVAGQNPRNSAQGAALACISRPTGSGRCPLSKPGAGGT